MALISGSVFHSVKWIIIKVRGGTCQFYLELYTTRRIIKLILPPQDKIPPPKAEDVMVKVTLDVDVVSFLDIDIVAGKLKVRGPTSPELGWTCGYFNLLHNANTIFCIFHWVNFIGVGFLTHSFLQGSFLAQN